MNKHEIIDIVEKTQQRYTKAKDKKYLKHNSQYFTPTNIAYKMLKTINFNNFSNVNTLFILEPAAGCGILVVNTVLYIIDKISHIDCLHFDIYEKDAGLIKILKDNLAVVCEYCTGKIKLTYNIINDNFITHNGRIWAGKVANKKYDLIISNPPFLKLNKGSIEAKLMYDVVRGQPNIYTLFICMCTKLLKKNGFYVLLSPRNYFSGDYSRLIRGYIFKELSLIHIHSFDKRNLFGLVNQEIVISTFIKHHNRRKVQISYNGEYSFEETFEKIIFNNESLSIIIPRDKADLYLFNRFLSLGSNLEDLGLKASVGPVVRFRNKGLLRQKTYDDGYALLLIAKDLQKNNVINYYDRECTRLTHNKSISIESKQLIKNNNYVLIRKVVAKDDRDLIIPAVLEKNFFSSELLGLDNNLIYFHKLSNVQELSLLQCYGLYCFINSNEFSNYYSLINGTHTINISEFKNIKFPNYHILMELGKHLLVSNNFSKNSCSMILSRLL